MMPTHEEIFINHMKGAGVMLCVFDVMGKFRQSTGLWPDQVFINQKLQGAVIRELVDMNGRSRNEAFDAFTQAKVTFFYASEPTINSNPDASFLMIRHSQIKMRLSV